MSLIPDWVVFAVYAVSIVLIGLASAAILAPLSPLFVPPVCVGMWLGLDWAHEAAGMGKVEPRLTRWLIARLRRGRDG